MDGLDVLALKGGLIVDKNFYDSPFTYSDGGQSITVPGNTVSKAVTAYEHEVAENESKREIYILKQQYFEVFVEEFKQGNLYSDSSGFISKRLKQTEVWATFSHKKTPEKFSGVYGIDFSILLYYTASSLAWRESILASRLCRCSSTWSSLGSGVEVTILSTWKSIAPAGNIKIKKRIKVL